MKIGYSYPPNRFAFPDPPQVAPVRAARPSSARSGRALSDKGGPGDAQSGAQSGAQGESRPEAEADDPKGARRAILHLNARL